MHPHQELLPIDAVDLTEVTGGTGLHASGARKDTTNPGPGPATGGQTPTPLPSAPVPSIWAPGPPARISPV